MKNFPFVVDAINPEPGEQEELFHTLVKRQALRTAALVLLTWLQEVSLKMAADCEQLAPASKADNSDENTAL